MIRINLYTIILICCIVISQGGISIINKPTRITPKSRTSIDYLYTHDVTKEITRKVLLHDISDRLPFVFHTPFSLKKKKYEKL